jgi:hypothetical protein
MGDRVHNLSFLDGNTSRWLATRALVLKRTGVTLGRELDITTVVIGVNNEVFLKVAGTYNKRVWLRIPMDLVPIELWPISWRGFYPNVPSYNRRMSILKDEN